MQAIKILSIAEREFPWTLDNQGGIMSSSHIYPYVYQLTHPITGEFYIGFRCANKVQSHDDLPLYRTSSKIIRPHFDDFTWCIIAEFFRKEDAYDFEQLLIHENWGNPLLLNQACHYGSSRFSTAGTTPTAETIEKRALKNRGRPGKIPTAETRAKMSASQKKCKQTLEFRSHMSRVRTGATIPPDTRAKISKSNSGRLLSDALGRTWVNNGVVSKFIHLEELDQGWVIGRLMNRIWITNGEASKMHNVSDQLPDGWRKGRHVSQDTRLKMSNSASNRQLSQ